MRSISPRAHHITAKMLLKSTIFVAATICIQAFLPPFGVLKPMAGSVSNGAGTPTPNPLIFETPDSRLIVLPSFLSARKPKDSDDDFDDEDWEPSDEDFEELDFEDDDLLDDAVMDDEDDLDIDVDGSDALDDDDDDNDDDDDDDDDIVSLDDDDDDDEDDDDDVDEDEDDVEDEDEDLIDEEGLDTDTEDEEEETEEYEWQYEYEEVKAPSSTRRKRSSTTSKAVVEMEEEFEDDEDFEDIPLKDNPDDENYQITKKMLEEAVSRREGTIPDRDFNPLEFLRKNMSPEFEAELDQVSADFDEQVENTAKDLKFPSEEEFEKIDWDSENGSLIDVEVDEDEREKELVEGSGFKFKDLQAHDDTIRSTEEMAAEEPWDKVYAKALRAGDFSGLSNETREEMEAALEFQGSSGYNTTQWLLYDLDFNVSNLFLAAFKHNPEAPIILHHWYPQLATYERYQGCRDRDFDFTEDDVLNADLSELERYYQGFGYEGIPTKKPAETNVIDVDELDEDEIKMVAYEKWFKEVYNPEFDRKDFDDESLGPEDNIFSHEYEAPDHPDVPSFEEVEDDIEEFNQTLVDDYTDEDGEPALTEEERQEIISKHVRTTEYEVVEDEEFKREFRGHLVIACGPTQADIDIAEKITVGMEKAHGKKVYVETRIFRHAREDDNVFEVWLESYNIDLLHSKRRATMGTYGWKGPRECDDEQVAYLVDKVGFLISDDARYSYSYEPVVPV